MSERTRLMRPDRPFAPARWPFFYGWVVLTFSAVGILASIPGQTMGVSVFSDHLLAATGLSRVGLANAYLVGTLTSGFMLPLGGRFLDRHGERQTAMIACVALAIALVGLSSVDGLARRAADVSGLDAVSIAFVALILGFTLLRFSGQGMLTLASRNMVPKWFERRRGLASGLLSVLTSLGFSLAPLVLGAWIESAGDWRLAWLQIALAVGVGMTLLAWCFYRDDPEQCGLQMDGGPVPVAAKDASRRAKPSADEPERSGDLSDALRTGAFWAVTLSISIHSAFITGITFHIVDLGSSAGLDQRASVGLFPPIAVVSVVVGLLSGMAADRFRLRYIVLALLVFEAIGYWGTAQLASPEWRALAIVGLGGSGGTYACLATVAPAKLFGRQYLGSISSAQMSALVLSSAVGPSLLAVAREYAGDYAPALLGGMLAPAVVFVLTLLSRDPVRGGRAW